MPPKPAAADQSAFAPEYLTTVAHFSASSATSLPKSVGEPRKHRSAQIGEARRDFRISKSGVDFAVEPVDMPAGLHDESSRACTVLPDHLAGLIDHDDGVFLIGANQKITSCHIVVRRFNFADVQAITDAVDREREFHELHHHRYGLSWRIITQKGFGCGGDQ
jgi:hypothetical protein